MNTQTNRIVWATDAEGDWLKIKVDNPRTICEQLRENTLYDVEIKEHKEKRSLSANSYFWTLIDQIATAIQSTKDEVYLEYIRQYGLYKDFTLTPDEAKTFRVVWEAFGTGWPTEQVDYAPDGNHVVIRAYYGSSQYDTKRMARLIDAVVDDCKQIGIETLSPEKLKSLVGDKNAQS